MHALEGHPARQLKVARLHGQARVSLSTMSVVRLLTASKASQLDHD
jgi:hypothetical protein